MSYGHTDKIAGRGDSTPAPGAEQPAPATDAALYAREDLRRILAALDIGGLYRTLKDDPGLSQRQIAQRTGQSQAEVADIVAGRRQVENYHLPVRIAEGLDILPERMGLSWWAQNSSRLSLALWHRHMTSGVRARESCSLEPPPGQRRVR